mgnify:CR=1 FL=1
MSDGVRAAVVRVAAVVELVRGRVPMFEFAIKSQLRLHNLETAEGRVSALRECAPIVAGIKDPTLRPEYARTLAGFGVPEGFAHVLADSDTGITRGELASESRDLSRLIGRPTTAVAQAVRDALTA